MDKGPDGKHYDFGWYAAKLQTSEIIVLLERAKYEFLKAMTED